ncbi:hypothetical protein [Streptomyces sp. NPDC126503]|uniref:hypothetical protein n=1 Tax=Streptomyces sp. NPDC126503 TaxID=3155315 RepID=UPI00332CBAED
MSGGSYNYLCAALDLEDLLSKRHDLDEMAKRLAGLGYAQDAARETEELLLLLRLWETRAEARLRRLTDVWRAVEWSDSNDSSETRVHEALAKYRGDHDDAGTPRA